MVYIKNFVKTNTVITLPNYYHLSKVYNCITIINVLYMLIIVHGTNEAITLAAGYRPNKV